MQRFLVVDDSASARDLVVRYLEDHGVCDTAGDGRQAVKSFEKALREGRPYSLVVMDIMMPVMDGLSAVKKIQAVLNERDASPHERPRIITLSSLDDPDHMMQAHYECGADIYITKPFPQAALIEALIGLGVAAPPADLADGCDPMERGIEQSDTDDSDDAEMLLL